MKKETYWFPVDEGSQWMLVGTFFGLIIMPMLLWCAVIWVIILIAGWFL